jgi:hypothetical protein
MHLFAVFTVFPYDPKIDSVMDHQHLVIAYCLTWFVHLGYLCYVWRMRYSSKE